MDHISLAAWLQITGPTFAVMVIGFGLLWNSQQTMTAQLLQVTRSLGNLEGAVHALDTRIDKLEGSISRLDARIDKLDERLDKLDVTVGKLSDVIQQLAQAVTRLAPA